MQTTARSRRGRVNGRLGGDSLLDAYMREISRIPLLDRATESQVAHRARKGDREARDLLVRSNLRFVVSVAVKYRHPGLSTMDIVNEGNLGLMRAAETFDPSRGFHFITYAIWWIKQSITSSIRERSTLIRLPARHVANQSNDMGLNFDCLSLNAPVGRTEYTLVDGLADPTNVTPATGIESSDMRREIDECLARLTSRERNVIQWRFGLAGAAPLTLEKTSAKVGVSKERTRQIERTALRKIRMNSRKQLMVYLN